MPMYISVRGEHYGVWSDETGAVVGDAIPAAKKTPDIVIKVAKLQSDFKAQAKKK